VGADSGRGRGSRGELGRGAAAQWRGVMHGTGSRVETEAGACRGGRALEEWKRGRPRAGEGPNLTGPMPTWTQILRGRHVKVSGA
jgi:hypothetical protein